MAAFLTAVKTTVKQNNDGSETGLKVVSTRSVEKPHPPPVSKPVQHFEEHSVSIGGVTAIQEASSRTPEEILQILRNQPSTTTLLRVLQQLQTGEGLLLDFSIEAIGPQQAQIINTLVSTTVPNFWSVLSKQDRKLLVSCLTNIAGIGAVIARVRLLTDQKPSKSEELSDLLAIVGEVFDQSDLVAHVWKRLAKAVSDATRQSLSWKEFVNLIGSGRVIATIARAEDALKDASADTVKRSWISNGSNYAAWLGKQIAVVRSCVDTEHEQKAACQAAALLLAKAFSLGYSVSLVKGVFKDENNLKEVLAHCQSFAKRQLIESTLQWLTQVSPESIKQADKTSSQGNVVSGLAACLHLLVSEDPTVRQHLLSFIADAALSSTISVPVRRAAIVTLASAAPDELEALLEKLFATFGDQLFINHAPLLQQESIAQTLLLAVGYLHRSTPMALLMTARSSGHMSGTSNRLHSSNSRARWLGMVSATAVSSLIDKEGSRMSFGTDELRTEESMWYQALVNVNDKIGNLQDFEQVVQSQSSVVKRQRKQLAKTRDMPIVNGKQTFGPARPPAQTEVIGEKVMEILDDEEDDEEDSLKPYAKPDSDAEDSDEDATLVNRNKARPPVYIRDLMRMLREDKDHDKFQLAIKHAAPLIRRKANFGKEVKDHAEELALTLSDLQDPFDTDDFDELKLQALIAVLLSEVDKLAPWLSRQVFSGDYSLSQRCIMLSALGLGGRELAGLKEQDNLNPALENTAFPSKQLPARLHAVYNPTSTKRLNSATTSLEQSIMRPLALSAADKTTSHLDAVKIKRFSNRDVQQRTKRKPAPNQLAKSFATHFFNPLITRYQQDLAAYGQRSTFTTPVVLTTFLKTLALLLHASGPSTASLPEVTSSFWDILFSLRVASLSDISVLEAVLFGLLTLLEVNCEWGDIARLAQEEPKRLAETQNWVQIVFERTGSGGLVEEAGGEEGRVRRLAAGVLVKCGEIVEGYQKSLGLDSGRAL